MAALVGKQAPTLVLNDQHGQPFDLSSVIGKEPACIFFYPAAMTYGCTKEACALRDLSSKDSFIKADSSKALRIIGISSDKPEKLKEFDDKYTLGYTLLSDPKKEARKAFGVAGSALLGFVPQRVTFIVDATGKVRATEDSAINMSAHSKLAEKWAETFGKEQAAAP